MTLKAAFDQIGIWTVTGVTVYGLDDFNGLAVPQGNLPALLPRVSGTGGETARPLGIAANDGKLVVHVDHHLLICGLGLSTPSLYSTLTYIDNYFAKVKTDWLLNGNLAEPLAVADTYEGPIEIGNVLYYGLTFRHRWVLTI